MSASDKQHRAGTARPASIHVVEALLFVGGLPLDTSRLSKAIPGADERTLQKAVECLNRRYQRQTRPYTIVRGEHGYRLTLRTTMRNALSSRFRSEFGRQLPRLATDVLSLVAYRQPVSREALETVIGDDVSGALRLLVRRRLIQPRPADPDDSAPPVYVTTSQFLDVFRLDRLSDLPTTSDLP